MPTPGRDPCLLQHIIGHNPPWHAEGRKRVSPLLRANRSPILSAVGQSLLGPSVPAVYPFKHAGIRNLSIGDGGVYEATDPPVGDDIASPNWGNTLSEIGDLLVDRGAADEPILFAGAYGATTIQDWIPGGRIGDRIDAIITRLHAHSYRRPLFLWQQGTSNWGSSYNDYLECLQIIVARLLGADLDAYVFVATETYNPNVTPNTWAPVAAAQAAVRDGVRVLEGANSDSLGVMYRRSDDGVHMNAELGRPAHARLWCDKIEPFLASNPT